MCTRKIHFIRYRAEIRRCRYCGYVGRDWGFDDECPSCGEVN